MNNWLSPIELTGKNVKLIPLSILHKEALLKAASDGELWNLWYTSVPSEATIDKYLETAIKQQESQTSLPFVIVDLVSDTIIGSTRFCNATPEHRRLEIGYTWYAKSYQRTAVNTECKYLLLQYAFEELQTIAVEFKTHWHNHRSRNAISRLGAKQDGVLRNHRIDADGSFRDTVVFSILREEWRTVKKALEFKMKER